MTKKITLLLVVLMLVLAFPFMTFAEETPSPDPTETPEAAGTPKPTDTPDTSSGPKVTKHPTGEKVELGGRCAFIARADNTKKYVWWFISPDGKKEVAASGIHESIQGLTVNGDGTEKLVLTKVPAELHNWKVYCRFYDKNGNVSSSKAALIEVIIPPTPTPVPDGIPVLTKSPTKETVTEGGRCTFIAKGERVDSFTWKFSKGKTVLSVKEAKNKFDGLRIEGETTGKIVLKDIPLEMDGWDIYCVLSNEKGEVSSKKASITVLEEEQPTKSPVSTNSPKPTGTPSTTATVVPTATATNAPVIIDTPEPTATIEPIDTNTPITTDDPIQGSTQIPSVATDTPSAQTPPTEKKDNSVLIIGLLCVGILLVGGGAGAAIIMGKRGHVDIDMENLDDDGEES